MKIVIYFILEVRLIKIIKAPQYQHRHIRNNSEYNYTVQKIKKDTTYINYVPSKTSLDMACDTILSQLCRIFSAMSSVFFARRGNGS